LNVTDLAVGAENWTSGEIFNLREQLMALSDVRDGLVLIEAYLTRQLLKRDLSRFDKIRWLDKAIRTHTVEDICRSLGATRKKLRSETQFYFGGSVKNIQGIISGQIRNIGRTEGQISVKDAEGNTTDTHAVAIEDMEAAVGQLIRLLSERFRMYAISAIGHRIVQGGPKHFQPEKVAETIEDDRNNLQPGDAILLIVEDDVHYARILCDLSRDKGFKVLVALRGTDALVLARELHPTAVSLDVSLPDMLGWTVLNHLKQDPATRHIPVQMLTANEDWHHGLSHGAFAFVTKPTTREGLASAIDRIRDYARPRRKRLLVVEDEPAQQLSIQALLDYTDIDVDVVSTGHDALAAVGNEKYDCIVLDLRLPDMTGFELLEQLSESDEGNELPVVVFTGKDLSPEEDARLHMLARSVIVKDVESPERLLDETALFLHRVVADLPPEKQNMLDRLHRSDEALVGRKVLVVDDDVRNIFALSSVLERRGMSVLMAGTGREAIATIESTPDLGIVLMDIMLPEMDGYETMQVIRQNPLFRRLPIIALTAKAMKGDREKCLQAGASEYLAKPVNTEQLLSSLRMWLHR